VYSSIISAAREAARYGAAGGRIDPNDLLSVNYFRDCNGIRAAAIRVAGIAGVSNTPSGVRIRYDNGITTRLATDPDQCPVNGTGPAVAQGDRIEVTVTAMYYPAQGIVKIPPLRVSSTVRRSVIVNVSISPDGRP